MDVVGVQEDRPVRHYVNPLAVMNIQSKQKCISLKFCISPFRLRQFRIPYQTKKISFDCLQSNAPKERI